MYIVVLGKWIRNFNETRHLGFYHFLIRLRNWGHVESANETWSFRVHIYWSFIIIVLRGSKEQLSSIGILRYDKYTFPCHSAFKFQELCPHVNISCTNVIFEDSCLTVKCHGGPICFSVFLSFFDTYKFLSSIQDSCSLHDFPFDNNNI
jgi:hypothetical protein